MNGDEVCTCGNVADEHADKGNGELELDPSLCAAFELDEENEDNISNGYVDDEDADTDDGPDDFDDDEDDSEDEDEDSDFDDEVEELD